MINDIQLDLPQIDPETRDLLDEEITREEVESAINEAQEISAPGPTGQTITLSTNFSSRRSWTSSQQL
jgi:hypothetical protein